MHCIEEPIDGLKANSGLVYLGVSLTVFNGTYSPGTIDTIAAQVHADKLGKKCICLEKKRWQNK